jgi:asparagine synthase (glutamine-hydrolysing)
MCGIVGIFKDKIESKWIKLMANTIKHRGPDDEGYLLVNTKNKLFEERAGDDSKVTLKHIDEPVNFNVDLALGHRRLSILDISPAGHQPMKYERDDKVVWIVYNGEVYNYLELKSELIERGYEFKTNTDTEVILASYLEWGFDCVKRFNGMWAFVIYDPDKNILFGSRDRFGVKPLYYYKTDDTFAFASEIKAILTLPFVKRIVNERILYDYLVYGILEHSEETFFDGIFKLMPFHSFKLNLDDNKLKIFKYYELKYNKSLGDFRINEFNTYKSKVKDLIFNAVKLRLRSDVPVGTCLSGGIDSSTIAVTINEILKEMKIPQIGKQQKVFTACYKNSDVDESFFAEKVVEKTKAEWHRTYPNARELLKDLLDLIYYQEEPFGSTSIYAQFRVMKLAKENNIKVLLDGQGGDELFTGYKPFYAVFFLDLIKNFRLLTIINELKNLKNSPISSVKELLFLIIRHIGAKFISSRLKLKVLRKLQPELKYINEQFIEKYKKLDIIKSIMPTSLNDFCYVLFIKYNLQQLLKYEDRNSMAHSIEARVPFSDDVELIEYVFSIPAIYKIHNGWSKYILREAMSDLLPKEVRFRTDKIGFATPERDWLIEIKDELKKLIDWENPYIDTKRLIKDFDKLVEKLPPSGLNTLWRLINTILWMRVFDVKPPD